VSFWPFKFQNQQFFRDLHLYLAFELFLCASGRRTLNSWYPKLASLARSSFRPARYRCWEFIQLVALLFWIVATDIAASYSSTYLYDHWWPTSIGDRNSLRGKYYPNLLSRHKGSQRIYVSLNRWVVNSAAPGNSLARSGLSVATVL
jgi:hypothetical protein